jgi:hypothetical protein
VQSRSVRRALGCWALALGGAVVATAAPLRGQAVLGYGDDATTVGSGTVRLGFTNLWSRWYQEYDASSGASIDTRSQIRRTLLSLDLGITNRLMFTATVPEAGSNEIATFFPDTARAIHADSVNSYDRGGIGDAVVSLKFVWLGQQTERERVAAAGFHVRSAVTVRARFGTGSPASPDSLFGVALGEGDSGAEVGSFWDVIFGRHFWTSVVGRYEHHLQDTRDIRVGAGVPGDPFDVTAFPVLTTRRLGDVISLEVTPRLMLGEYFSIGAQYQYVHEAAGTFTGTADITDSTGAVMHLDASSLDASSQFTEQWAGGGIVFSTVAASEQGGGKYPVEILLRYRRAISLSGGRPVRGEWGVGLRFYTQLWGRSLVGRDAPSTTQRVPGAGGGDP